MSEHKKFWVLDHTGATVACKDNATDAVKLAKEYARANGVANVMCGKRRKRFLASGAAFTVRGGRK